MIQSKCLMKNVILPKIIFQSEVEYWSGKLAFTKDRMNFETYGKLDNVFTKFIEKWNQIN